jgi:hypothetical protein
VARGLRIAGTVGQVRRVVGARGEAELLGDGGERVVGRAVQPGGTHVEGHAEGVVIGVRAPADAIAGLEHRHAQALASGAPARPPGPPFPRR